VRPRWLKWTLRVFAVCIALLATAIAAIFIINPAGAPLLLSMLIYPLFMNTSPPAVFKDDVAGMWLKWEESGKRLTAHLHQQFPPGTAATMLKATLLKQGFSPEPPPAADCVPAGRIMPVGQIYRTCPNYDTSKTLTYRWGSPICTETITVRWATDDGDTITDVSAGHYAACL
jgi:hypothetical protein